MNPNDGGGQSHSRRRPRPPGFPDFGADPFFGGSLLGNMMGGSSFFDDFFSRDPFDDPFFSRPIGMGMLGRDHFGRGPRMGMNMNSFFDQSGFFSRPDGSLLDQQPYRSPPPQLEGRRGPVIEELTDDVDEETPNSQAQSGGHPIVEHPEDEEDSGSLPQHREQAQQAPPRCQALSNRSQHQSLSTGYGNGSNNAFQSFSFQSSSTSFGGSGGSFYSSSSMRRVGQNGLVQEEHIEKDSAGRETRMSARGLRDQGHAIRKKRNTASGPESTVETLRNLTPEEAPHFDAQWEAHAESSLPGWNQASRIDSLEGRHPRSHRPVLPALHHNDEGSMSRRARR